MPEVLRDIHQVWVYGQKGLGGVMSELAKERHNAKVVGYTKCGVCGDQMELLEGVDYRKVGHGELVCMPCDDYFKGVK